MDTPLLRTSSSTVSLRSMAASECGASTVDGAGPPAPPPLWRLFLAELLGTFVLLSFGIGVGSQVVLSNKGAGDYLSINLGWGIGVVMGAYIGLGVSGGHLNPAVTVANAVFGRVSWSDVPAYIAGQFLGAFLGAAAVFGNYQDALNHFDGGVRHVTGDLGTAALFATYPQAYVSVWQGFYGQVFSTGLLLASLFAICDPRNAVPKGAIPPLAGLTVVAIGTSFGLNTGYPINPARDFAPRLFTYIAGWGPDVWLAGDHWAWVPIVAPVIGGVLGAGAYEVCVGRWSHEATKEQQGRALRARARAKKRARRGDRDRDAATGVHVSGGGTSLGDRDTRSGAIGHDHGAVTMVDTSPRNSRA